MTKNALEVLEVFSDISVHDEGGRVGSSHASYSGGLGFKSQPGDRLSWLRSFVIFLRLSKYKDIPQIRSKPLPIMAHSIKFSPTSYNPMLYSSGIQPGVRVPPGVREDILGGK
jgi:hypothetical protein